MKKPTDFYLLYYFSFHFISQCMYLIPIECFSVYLQKRFLNSPTTFLKEQQAITQLKSGTITVYIKKNNFAY